MTKLPERESDKPVLVSTGVFDGVHKGHRYLLQCLRRRADLSGMEPAVVTFSNHPLTVIRPDSAPKALCDIQERVRLIRREGIDNVLVLDFDEDLRHLTAREFVSLILKPRLNVKGIFLGYDNAFGSDRPKSVEELRKLMEPEGVEVLSCEPYGEMPVSSSMIRENLGDGDIEKVRGMLGRPYIIKGKVVHGKKLGRTIGFPTANLDTGQMMLPRPGVYAARVADVTGHTAMAGLPAMLNIGTAPTVNTGNSHRQTVEVHIIAQSQPIPDIYGEVLALEVVRRLRDERKFDSLDQLQAAIGEDRQHTLNILK